MNCSPICNWSFCYGCFNIFSLSLVFSSLVLMCKHRFLLLLSFLGLSKLLESINLCLSLNLRCFLVIFLQILSVTYLTPFLQGSQWYWYWSTGSSDCLCFNPFFVCSSDWIISIDSNSLTLLCHLHFVTERTWCIFSCQTFLYFSVLKLLFGCF